MEIYEGFSFEEIIEMERANGREWPRKSMTVVTKSVTVKDASGKVIYSYGKPEHVQRPHIPMGQPQLPENLTKQLRHAIMANKIKTFAHAK